MNKKIKNIEMSDQKSVNSTSKQSNDFVEVSVKKISIQEPKEENESIAPPSNTNTTSLKDDFIVESNDTIDDSKIHYDPKTLYRKSLETKRKPQIYSTVRVFLIIFGLFFFVLISALSIGYNISEFENPNFAENEIINEIKDTINPNLPDHRNRILSNDINQNIYQNRGNYKPPLSTQILHQNERREMNLLSKLMSLSFEFVIVAAILTLLSYLIYRHTDWPFVKNKVLIAFLIIMVSILISFGFWFLFRNDNRIPRMIRGNRDIMRERIFRRQAPSSQIMERVGLPTLKV